MAIRTKTDDDEEIVAEINITPLTDVFLVLLIIFMISSSAILESGLNVKLPSSSSGGISAQNKKPTFITISGQGEISVNQKKVSEGDLSGVLKEALLSSDRSVVIRGDRSIDLGKAVKIMDLAKSAGAEKIAIATQPSQ